MAEHAAIRPGPGAAEQGEKLPPSAHFSVPSCGPSGWELDEYGAPRWIVDEPGAWLGPWAWIIPSVHLDFGPLADRWAAPPLSYIRAVGPAAMPTLRQVAQTKKRLGRPSLDETRPEEVRAAAWLADIRGLRRREIAAALRLADVAPGPMPRHVLRQARTYVEAGRRLLGREGVLPWICWAGAKPPPPSWWASPFFISFLVAWYIRTIQVRAPVELLVDQLRSAARSEHVRTRWDPQTHLGRSAADLAIESVPGEEHLVRARLMSITAEHLFRAEEERRRQRQPRRTSRGPSR